MVHPRLLLDTNVSSFLLDRREPQRSQYAPVLKGRTLHIAAQTHAEHWYGAAKAGWGRQRLAELVAHLDGLLFLPPDQATCRAWGELRVAAERQGRVLSAQDAWVGNGDRVGPAPGLPRQRPARPGFPRAGRLAQAHPLTSRRLGGPGPRSPAPRFTDPSIPAGTSMASRQRPDEEELAAACSRRWRAHNRRW